MQQTRQNTAGRQVPQNNPHRNPQNNSKKAPAKKPPVKKAVSAQPKVGAKKTKDPNSVRFWSMHGRVDAPMLIIILVLLAFGITMMFSAGHAWSYVKNGDSFYYILHQLPAAGLGLVGMFLLTFFDYRFLRHEISLRGGKTRFTPAHILLISMMFLNFLCLPFGVSNTEDGQKRWLRIPVFGTFQPSDFLKIAVIIFLAYYIHKNSDVIRKFYVGLFKPGMLFLAIAVILYVIQTHLSALVIIFMVCAVMLFVGGINVKPAIILAGVAILVAVLAIKTSDSYFADRIKYMDPLSEPGWRSYQNYQSALAIGSGGIWGKGFGNSDQKRYYLPESQNDFVYSILVEEFGLVGGVLIIFLFLMFVIRGFQIARASEDKFGCLLATGITFQIGIQAMLNIAVTLCCIPNTGVSLPFFSYGGTALMIQLWEMGLLLSVSKRAKLK